MTLKVSFLKAAHGDAIVIETCVGTETFRILIDGGPPECYERRQGGKRTAGPLQEVIEDLRQRGERFDLTIVTHVDDDHIGGLLKAFRHEKHRSVIANDVWFNSGKIIAQAFNTQVPEGSDIWIDDPEDRLTSIAQGVEFDALLDEHCAFRRQVRFVDGREIWFKHGKIFILSPTEQQLTRLLSKWETEEADSLTSGMAKDYHLSLPELRTNDKFVEDTSVHNASSIAVLIETQGHRVLLLGDALPSTVCSTLREHLGVSPENPLEVSVCKLSHHGSKANTSEDLLSLIRCEKFVVSTNGMRHALPSKTTLARINDLQPNSEILFNYESVRDDVFPNLEERAASGNIRALTGDLIL